MMINTGQFYFDNEWVGIKRANCLFNLVLNMNRKDVPVIIIINKNYNLNSF